MLASNSKVDFLPNGDKITGKRKEKCKKKH